MPRLVDCDVLRARVEREADDRATESAVRVPGLENNGDLGVVADVHGQVGTNQCVFHIGSIGPLPMRKMRIWLEYMYMFSCSREPPCEKSHKEQTPRL